MNAIETSDVVRVAITTKFIEQELSSMFSFTIHAQTKRPQQTLYHTKLKHM